MQAIRARVALDRVAAGQRGMRRMQGVVGMPGVSSVGGVQPAVCVCYVWRWLAVGRDETTRQRSSSNSAKRERL